MLDLADFVGHLRLKIVEFARQLRHRLLKLHQQVHLRGRGALQLLLVSAFDDARLCQRRRRVTRLEVTTFRRHVLSHSRVLVLVIRDVLLVGADNAAMAWGGLTTVRTLLALLAAVLSVRFVVTVMVMVIVNYVMVGGVVVLMVRVVMAVLVPCSLMTLV